MSTDPFQKQIDDAAQKAGGVASTPPLEPAPPLPGAPAPKPIIEAASTNTQTITETKTPETNTFTGLVESIKETPSKESPSPTITTTTTTVTAPIITEKLPEIQKTTLAHKKILPDETSEKLVIASNKKAPPQNIKKPSKLKKLIIPLILILITLPIAVYYGSQQWQITEMRRKAYEAGAYPDYAACTNNSDCISGQCGLVPGLEEERQKKCLPTSSHIPTSTPTTVQNPCRGTCRPCGSAGCGGDFCHPGEVQYDNKWCAGTNTVCCEQRPANAGICCTKASGNTISCTGKSQTECNNAATCQWRPDDTACPSTNGTPSVCPLSGAEQCIGNNPTGDCYTNPNGYICRKLNGNPGKVTTGTSCTCPPEYPWGPRTEYGQNWCFNTAVICTPTGSTSEVCGLTPGTEPNGGCVNTVATPTLGGPSEPPSEPSNTPTTAAPSNTPTSVIASNTSTDIPPSNTPTDVLPSNTPTDIPPTEVPTEVPTDTPVSPYCDASCETDNNCPSDLYCISIGGTNRCRNASCPDQSDCSCNEEAPTNTPYVPGQPTATTRYYAQAPTATPVVRQPTATQKTFVRTSITSRPTIAPSGAPTPKIPVAGTPSIWGIATAIGGVLLLILGLLL